MITKKFIKICLSACQYLILSVIIVLVFWGNSQAAYMPNYLKNNNGSTIPVLMYHRIINDGPTSATADIEKQIFENQIRYLKNNNYQSLSLDELDNKLCLSSNQEKFIVLTFDDGYKDFYQNAYPILQKYNMKATVFMIVAAIGDPPDFPTSNYHLNLPEIKEMESSGLVKIESHTMTHKNLAQSSYDDAIYEIATSKNILESDLGRAIRYFSYPYGGKTQTILSLVNQYYNLAFNIVAGNVSCYSNKIDINRQIPRNESFLGSINNYYMPYIPDPQARAAKIKLKMAEIINGSGHSSITKQSKIYFFEWLEKNNYFWLDTSARQQMRQNMLGDNKYTFNDGTPWAYVLGDGENAVSSLLGSADTGKIVRIQYANSLSTYQSIISLSKNDRIYASLLEKFQNIIIPKVKAESTSFTFDAAIIPYQHENNQSNMFEFSSLSIEQQESVYNQIQSVISNYQNTKNVNINKIKIGNSTNSFVSTSEDSASSSYIFDEDNNLIINEKIFLLGNASEQQDTLSQAFEDWSLL